MGNDLGTITAHATMAAAVEILRQRQVDPMHGVDIDALCVALRREAKVALGVILENAPGAIGLGEMWCRELVKVESVAAARRAVESLGVSA